MTGEQLKAAGTKLFGERWQSKLADKLGMAIVMPAAQVAGTATAPNADTDIRNTYLMKANIKENQPVVFRFYAGWEKSDARFATAAGFQQFLKEEMAAAVHKK